MSNETISERMSMRKFMNAVKPAVEFGRKPAPEPETADDAGARRTQEVTARANAEKKSYGFLRSLSKRAFGKKEVEQPAPVQRQERTEDERRDAVMARAKTNEEVEGEEAPDQSPQHDALVKAGYKHLENQHGGMGKNYVYRDAGKNEIRHKISNAGEVFANHRFGHAHMGDDHTDVASAVKANR